MKFLSAGLFLGLLALPVAAPSAIIFGNLDISQTGGGGSDVTLALSYSSSAAMTVGYNSTRGDFVVDFDPAADSDRVRGILISSASQLFRDNSALGDSPAGVNYATASIATTTSNRYFIPTTVTSGSALGAGDEININVAAAYFSYADGWIGGHVRSANATVTAADPLDTLIGSSGLVLTSTTPSAGDTNYIYDDPATNGVYQIKLSNAQGVINSVTDGLLLVVGGDNVGRYALSRSNADGTWTVVVRANDANGSTKVNGEFGFVYVPKTSAVSTGTGIYALGRVNANMTRDIEGGNFILVHSSEGTYTLYAPGLNPLTSTLILSPEASTGGEDNIWMYGTFGKGWRIQTRDLPEALLQELTGDIDLFSFALMSDRTTLTNWTNQGSGTSWDTAANWANSTLPTSGNDVIFSTLSGSSSVSLATAKTVGMLTITSNTGFDITGSALLTVDTGIAVNATPTSAQNYTVSTPIQFSADAFVISQSLSTSPVSLIFNNTLTANNKNLLFTGGTQNDVASVTAVSRIDVNGVINLGTGSLIKEGTSQLTLNAANVYSGGTIIRYGPNLATAGAIRINAAAGYGAFGSGDIIMENTLSITALYFDNGAGSGTLANNIKLQTTTDGISTRITVDAASNFDATLSGVISGGHSLSQLLIDNDSNTDAGRLHLTQANNTFLASNINIVRGGLVVYGDGSLGNANNDLVLNVNSTSTRTGLQFGSATTLNSNRTVRVDTETVVHTYEHAVTIQGEVTGDGIIDKHGTGSLVLGGNNTTYGGAINVNEGTLVVNGLLANNAMANSFITVKSGASLRGTGVINRLVTVNSGAVLDAGGLPSDSQQGIGQLTVTGSLTLNSGSRVDFHLGSSGNDKIVSSTGTLSVANGAGGTRFQIVLDYTPTGSRQFDLLDWATLLYAGADLASQLDLPTAPLGNGLSWDTSRFHAEGIISIVPEPSRAVLLLLGVCGLIWRRRRVRGEGLGGLNGGVGLR